MDFKENEAPVSSGTSFCHIAILFYLFVKTALL